MPRRLFTPASVWYAAALLALLGVAGALSLASTLPDSPAPLLLAAGFLVFVLSTAVAGHLTAAVIGRQHRAIAVLRRRHQELEARGNEHTHHLEQDNRALHEDIAARSRAERLLRESEERFRAMVEGVVDYAIIVLDPLGNVSSWNAGAERITGYRSDEIIGQHVSLFYARSDVDHGRPQSDLDSAASTGRFEDEGLRIRKDGTAFWASEVTTLIRGTSGKLLGFSRVTRDLTERRRTEKLLQESEERFRMMVDSVVDYAIYMLNPEGRVASWNSGAARIYGYLGEEIIGQHVSRFYPKLDAEQSKHDRELELAAVAGRFESESWRVRKDGSTFWASVAITAVRDGTGRLVGFSKVTRDLTERRRVELELLGAKAAAERASKAKTEFLATMSHELRTPLNSLLILSRLLSENVGENLTAKQVEYAKTIHSSGLDLLSLINDILDLARIESGAQTPLHFTVEEFSRIAADLERTFRQVAESKNLGFDVVLDPELPPGMRTDGQRLRQIVKNLLSNAFKFTKHGRVTLRIAPARSGWTPGHDKLDAARRVVAITVMDTGIGIAQDKHEIIFEPFQQADGGTSREYGGTGLGLSISRALARLLGGELRLSSRVGEGSTFTLYLPLVTDLPPGEAARAPGLAAATGSK